MNYLFVMVFLFISCAHKVKKEIIYEHKKVGLGEIQFIKIKDFQNSEFICNELIYKVDRVNGFALVYVPLDFALKTTSCNLTSEKDNRKIIFSINDDSFKTERLRVDPSKVVLNKKNLNRALEEKQLVQTIYKNSKDRLLITEAFVLPIETKVTSSFGTKRTYNGVKKSQHSGIDFRAQVGQFVYASNSGKVVLNKNLFFTGNTIILDHGLGLFSIYGHLNSSTLKVGEIVRARDLIGFAGNTGRSTGPHLHWGIKFLGKNASGKSLIENSKIVFPLSQADLDG